MAGGGYADKMSAAAAIGGITGMFNPLSIPKTSLPNYLALELFLRYFIILNHFEVFSHDGDDAVNIPIYFSSSFTHHHQPVLSKVDDFVTF